jgi:hypothetical protein
MRSLLVQPRQTRLIVRARYTEQPTVSFHRYIYYTKIGFSCFSPPRMPRSSASDGWALRRPKACEGSLSPSSSSDPKHASSNCCLPRVQPVDGADTCELRVPGREACNIQVVELPSFAYPTRRFVERTEGHAPRNYRAIPIRPITLIECRPRDLARIPCSDEAESSACNHTTVTWLMGSLSLHLVASTHLASRQARARPKYQVIEKPHRNAAAGEIVLRCCGYTGDLHALTATLVEDTSRHASHRARVGCAGMSLFPLGKTDWYSSTRENIGSSV